MDKRFAVLIPAALIAIAAANGWLPGFAKKKPSIEEQIENAWRTPEAQDSEPFKVAVSAESAAALRAVIAGEGAADTSSSSAPTAGANISEDKSRHVAAEGNARQARQNNLAGAAQGDSPPSDPEEQYQLALAYADVSSPNFDMTQAEHLFTLAAKQGHMRAMKRLGDIYRYASPPDVGRAMSWYGYPAKFAIGQGGSLIGSEADFDALGKAHTALLVEKYPPRTSNREPITAYDLGLAIGAILKYTTDGRAESNTQSDAGQSMLRADRRLSSEVATCRAEAQKHIMSCYKDFDYSRCDGGCAEKVHCDRRLTPCVRHDAPYGERGRTFYCDHRNWKTRDFDYEKVLERTCPLG